MTVESGIRIAAYILILGGFAGLFRWLNQWGEDDATNLPADPAFCTAWDECENNIFDVYDPDNRTWS